MKQLTNNEILKYAPSAGAAAPFYEVSNKYSFLPTIRIVDMLREKGWFPTRAEQIRVRRKERDGVQKHLIRFQHPDLQLGDEAIEAVLVNSHDRSCAYNLLVGVFRLICSNGMITGDTFERISVRHINFNPKEIVYASLELIDNAPTIAGSINEMKEIDLDPDERGVFAKAAHQLLYDEPEKAPIAPDSLLAARRSDDKQNDLWVTFNKVQENMIKGGIPGFSKKSGKQTVTRPIRSIDRNIRLNRALWTLAEGMKKLRKEKTEENIHRVQS
jgi:hypothetical protein